MPTIRSAKTAELICDRIAQGLSVRQIAKNLGCNDSAITRWAVEDADFGQRYARAREAQAEHMAAEILEIADDATNDWMERALSDGRIVEVPNQEVIGRSRLRVDTRKWLMAKVAAKTYGDKPQDVHVTISLRDLIKASVTIEHEEFATNALPALAHVEEKERE